MTSDSRTGFVAALKAIVGDTQVLTDSTVTRPYRTGFRCGGGAALAVLTPRSLVELWKVLQVCVDTFPKDDKQRVFNIGTRDPAELTQLRRHILAHFENLPSPANTCTATCWTSPRSTAKTLSSSFNISARNGYRPSWPHPGASAESLNL